MATKLFVGGLSWGTTDESLRNKFGEFGAVTDAIVIMDKFTARSRGFGFVSYDSADEANAAISAMDGQDFEGRILKVNIAEGRENRGEGGGFRGGRGGFRGGRGGGFAPRGDFGGGYAPRGGARGGFGGQPGGYGGGQQGGYGGGQQGGYGGGQQEFEQRGYYGGGGGGY